MSVPDLYAFVTARKRMYQIVTRVRPDMKREKSDTRWEAHLRKWQFILELGEMRFPRGSRTES
jgi:hypothetical protein